MGMHNTGRRLFGLALACILFLMLPAPAPAQQPKPLSVTFISPSDPAKRPFWNDFIAFMEIAARDLGIDLKVLVAHNRYEVNDLAREALFGQARPDYLVHIYQKGSTPATLKMSRDAGVKSLIVNTDVVEAERNQVGSPRGLFTNWIGHLYPDDAKAGRMLAERLIERARQADLRATDGKIHLVGLGGNLAATSSLYRKAGLEYVASTCPDVVMDHFVLAYWKRQVAHEKALSLLSLHPEATVFWAINDHTAMGVLDAVRDRNAVPGTDVLTGGIDWSPGCIQEVRDGSMVATLGGHFMEGAWALILLLDYHNGHDFARPDATIKSEMRIIDDASIDRYVPVLDRDNWPRIDFKRLSRTCNPELKDYDFSPDALAAQLSPR